MKVYFLCDATLAKKPEHSTSTENEKTVIHTKVFLCTLGSILQHTDIMCVNKLTSNKDRTNDAN